MKPNKISLASINDMCFKRNKSKKKHCEYYCWEFNNYHCRGKDARYNKLIDNQMLTSVPNI